MFSPAVSHDRPGVGRVEELDLSYESKQSGGVAGDAVVGPAGEVKLTEFADLVMTLLENTHGRDVTTRDAYFTAAIAQNDSVAILSPDDDECTNLTNFIMALLGKTNKKTYHGSAD